VRKRLYKSLTFVKKIKYPAINYEMTAEEANFAIK